MASNIEASLIYIWAEVLTVTFLGLFSPKLMAQQQNQWTQLSDFERSSYISDITKSTEDKLALLSEATASEIVAIAAKDSLLSYSLAGLLPSIELVENGLQNKQGSMQHLAGFCLRAIDGLEVVDRLSNKREENLNPMENVLRDFVVQRIRKLLQHKPLNDEILTRLTSMAVPQRIEIKIILKRYKLLPKSSITTRVVMSCINMFDYLIVRRNRVFGDFKTD